MKPDHYTPCFSNVAHSWWARWDVIREFVRRWYGEQVGRVGTPSDSVDRVDTALPPSFREWVEFVHELDDVGELSFIGKCFDVSRLDKHAATCLMMGYEGDCFYAVQDHQLNSEDPPVDDYVVDHVMGAVSHRGTCYASITGFALSQVFAFLHGEGGGCHISVPKTPEFLRQLCDAFSTHCRFDNLDIFEDEDVLAFMFDDQSSDDECHLVVEVFRSIPIQQIPDCVHAHLRNGGGFRGIFETALASGEA